MMCLHKESGTPNHSPKIGKQGRNGHTRKGLGYAFTRNACFVCGSFSHLIRDCDFHEKEWLKKLNWPKARIRDLKDKGIVDSGCSRHMTGNKAHLADYQEFKGGSVAFRGRNGRITSKGKIKAGKLDFKDVYYVEELKHYNLFSVSQMCDKKNKVLFTDIDCLVMSPAFKLHDENQVLHKILRRHNIKESNTRHLVRPRQFSWVYFLKSKDEITPILKDFIRQAENQFNHKVKTIRSDNGTEFKNNELIEFCRLKGIKMKYSNARTPQQNRVVERKNKSLIEAARTMVLVTKPQNKTSYELLTGKQPIISYLRPFRCHVTILNTIDQLVENQANKSAGPKEANNSTGTQANDDQGANSEEIYLHEEHFVLPIWPAYSTTVKSSGDKIDKNTDFKSCEKPLSQVEQLFLEELEKLKRHKKEANDAARKETTHENQNAHTNITNLFITISMPLSVVGPSRAFNDGDPSYLDDPSMPHLEDIYTSPSEEILLIHPMMMKFQIQKVWIHVDLPFRKKAIGTKWVYMSKKDKRGVVVRNKAQLVSLGHRQEEGIDYDGVLDFVAKIEAIRIFLAFASYMGFIVYQMDVKSAFLYGTIDEEVYVTQPPSFVDPKFPNKVYKVVKALYGLHQAPRAWYATLSTFLEQSRNRRGDIDKTLFIKKDKKDIIVKTASTPIETQKPFFKYKEAADVDVILKTSHLQAVKIIFRYLKGQPKLGLWYPKVSLFDLEAYSDSDYSGANLDKKSTTGGCQFLDRRLILWQCKKQTIVAISTTEVEYVAVAHCDVIRQALHLNDVDGVECLPNEEIFIELTRMGYEKPPPKLTFYKAFFSAKWKFLIHTLVQCVSAKRIAWNEFSCSIASAVICLAIGRKINFSKYIFDSMVRNVDSPSKFLMYPRFHQVIINAQVDDLSSHTNQYTSPALTQKLFANMRRVVAQLEQDKISQALEILKLKKRVKKLKKKKRLKSSGLKRRMHPNRGKIEAIDADEDITLTLFKMKAKKSRLLDDQMAKRLHDEKVEQAAAKEKQEKDDLEKDKVLQKYLKRKPISIAQSRKNMIIYLKNMAGYKMEHFRGMTYDNVRPIFEREYNNVQTLFKPDKDVKEPQKKRVAEETLLHESFKKLKVVGVSGSHSTQDTITSDPREISEEDVKNMLEIVPVSEFKVEALQVNAKLQVKEDSEMARDLVMKIFMEANKLKSGSLDISSK
nr:retrovirus-related Pol polyprotein from transposon TNT 1-94 [Tanacetum cinerariifolium]